MYITKEQQKNHLKEIKKEAKKLGLVQSNGMEHVCVFCHPDPPIFFDLSATDPKKIMLKVYQETIRVGRNQKADEILDALQPE